MSQRRYLYLLHFTRPFHHAKHYLGLAHDVASRIEEHVTSFLPSWRRPTIACSRVGAIQSNPHAQ